MTKQAEWWCNNGAQHCSGNSYGRDDDDVGTVVLDSDEVYEDGGSGDAVMLARWWWTVVKVVAVELMNGGHEAVEGVVG